MIYVKILGTGIHEQFKAKEHKILAHPAGTYHEFIMPDGTTLLFNDFGVRSVTIADKPEKLN